MFAPWLNRAYKRAVTARLDGSDPQVAVPDGGRCQQLFTKAMFALMGRVAKLDGRVVAGEVRYASTIMQLLDMDSAQRRQAIDFFEQGKQPNADVLGCVRDLVRVIGLRSDLAHLFLKVQCRLAYVKGDIRLKEKLLLRDVAEQLGFSKAEFLAICTDMEDAPEQIHFKSSGFLDNAYRVLQLEPDVDDGEIRRAYLRMMSRYHPDKLVRDNLSEETLKQAQEKFRDIRSAYETVCGYRKIRA